MAKNYDKKILLIVNEAIKGIGHEFAFKSATRHFVCNKYLA